MSQNSGPRTSAKGTKFCSWNLTDLDGGDITLLLFGEVFQAHWKEIEGRMIAVLNPRSMPAKEGSRSGGGGPPDGDNRPASITVDHATQILVMGVSRDYGHCRAVCRSGEPCKMAINKKTREYCRYHISEASKELRRVSRGSLQYVPTV